jgi:V8-like Glu-specific endopeptidase
MSYRTGLLTRELEDEWELEDEFEAGLGFRQEPGIEYSVIGTDDRFQIPARQSRPSSLLFPTNTICFLEILQPNGSVLGSGTGTLIAPQVVLTAKHVLMNVAPPRCAVGRSIGQLFPRIRVTPGADLTAGTERLRRPAAPGSSIAAALRFQVHPTLDYGIIALPTPFTRPNQFMMLQPRSAANTATLLTIAGYPCDKPTGTMWGHSERIPMTGVSPTHLTYTLDTCPGHSGSPVWLLGNAGIRLLLGVHTSGSPGGGQAGRCANDPLLRNCLPTGTPVTPVSGDNCGVRVTCQLIRNLLVWCQEFGVRRPNVDQVAFRNQCGAPVPPTRPPHPRVHRGARGPAVTFLQGQLNAQFLLPSGRAPLLTDGVFGPRTEAAVRAFQTDRGLVLDGIVGPQTWGALQTL